MMRVTARPDAGRSIMARTLAEMVASARSETREISPAEVAGEDGAPVLIIDVREAGEFQ
jgi:hypothetical protein